MLNLSILGRCVNLLCGTLPCGGLVAGTVPLDLAGPLIGKLPLVRTFRITQPAVYARAVLIEALAAAVVVVDAAVVGPNAASKLPAAAVHTADTRVAELLNP